MSECEKLLQKAKRKEYIYWAIVEAIKADTRKDEETLLIKADVLKDAKAEFDYAKERYEQEAAKDYRMRVADSMKRFEDKRIETDDFIVTTRTSKSVEILNADEIPPEFMKTTTVVEPMKKLIADELKKGNEVSGATLKENTSLQIR